MTESLFDAKTMGKSA